MILKSKSKSQLNCMLNTCSHANVPCVLMCSRTLRAYVITCHCALRAYVLMCQHALRAYVLMCQRTLHVYVLTCQSTLRAYVSRTNVFCVLTCSRALSQQKKSSISNISHLIASQIIKIYNLNFFIDIIYYTLFSYKLLVIT